LGFFVEVSGVAVGCGACGSALSFRFFSFLLFISLLEASLLPVAIASGAAGTGTSVAELPSEEPGSLIGTTFGATAGKRKQSARIARNIQVGLLGYLGEP
jgi:hypothetical protein